MAGRNWKRLYTTGKGDCVATKEKIGRPEGKNAKKNVHKIWKFNTQANVERKRLKAQEKNNERWRSKKYEHIKKEVSQYNAKNER